MVPALLGMDLAACGDEAFAPCFDVTVDIARCDPARVSFSLESTNPYYPLRSGSLVVLEGVEDGELIRVERRVLADTRVIDVAGIEVTTHVLEARELIGGALYEVARNFYVEAMDGTVCYFGEDVDFYEDGALVDHHGSWRAGVKGAKPGIIMPAEPVVGDAYYQEHAPGVAMDMGRVASVAESVLLGGTPYANAVVVHDANPLESCAAKAREAKVYLPGIGEAADTVKELVSYE